MVEIVLPLFELEWKDLKKTINKSFKGKGDVHLNDYIEKVLGALVKKKGQQGSFAKES